MYEFLLPIGLLAGEPPYWYAVVRPNEFPPTPYTGQPRNGSPEAETRVLILEPGGGIDAFLSPYDASLAYQTDSWYPTREAAVEDVTEEFGDSLGAWTPVPEEEHDAELFVLRRVST
jgi:hypothetical protein